MNKKKKFYVTTPIYYPNDIPHIGSSYPTIAADAIARYKRLRGYDVFFLTGTDEHGKKIENVARAAGTDTQKFVDEKSQQFKDAWKELNIQYNRFIRTTDDDHTKVVQEILAKVWQKGDIYKGVYEGLYCVDCEAYYTEKDLIDGNCPYHKRKVPLLKEDSYFFKLSQYQDKLLEFYEKNPEFISPDYRKQEIINRVKDGLNDLSISRTSFEWGIKIPFDEKHITYVWFDALTNYITGAGYKFNPSMFEKFWPCDVHIIGKDILWFHAVIWPAMLFSAGVEPPKKVFAHGFWTINGQKFSKSLGNVIYPSSLTKKYGVDQYRYFLLRETPFGGDGDFSEKALVTRANTDLADDLGNLLNRVLVMIERYCEGKIPERGALTDADHDLITSIERIIDEVDSYMDKLDFSNALSRIWEFIDLCNKYINEQKPWELAKSNSDIVRINTVLYNLTEALALTSALIAPFMPSSAEKIAKQLSLSDIRIDLNEIRSLLKSENKIQRLPDVLFPKIEMKVEAIEYQPIRYRVDPRVKVLGINTCLAEIRGINPRKKSLPLETIKKDIEKIIKLKSKEAILSDPVIKEFNNLYEKIGKKPGEIRSPIEYLVDIIHEKGNLPTINAVVDSYNIVALKTFVSIGIHDRAKINGDVVLNIANHDIEYAPVGQTGIDRVKKGEYYWHDDKSVLCRLDIKQGDATKVDENSTNLVVIVQGNKKIPDAKLRSATTEVCESIVKYCGGEYKLIEERPSEEKTASFHDFEKLDIRVGEITLAEPVENSNELMKLTVNCGGNRTLVAKIVKSYSTNDLIGMQVALIANLEPRVIHGIKSEGMLLAVDESKPVLLVPEKRCAAGKKIR